SAEADAAAGQRQPSSAAATEPGAPPSPAETSIEAGVDSGGGVEGEADRQAEESMVAAATGRADETDAAPRQPASAAAREPKPSAAEADTGGSTEEETDRRAEERTVAAAPPAA